MKLASKLHRKHFCKGAFTVKTAFGLFRESFDDRNGGRNYWSLSLVTQSRDVYILPSRFVCLPHLFKYTRPRIPIGYEPRAVPLIICVILCLSAPVRSFGRDHSVSFCVFCVFLRLFKILIGNNSSRHTRHHRNIIPPASHFHSRHIYTILNSLHNISHHN